MPSDGGHSNNSNGDPDSGSNGSGGGGDTSGGMSPDAREGSEESGYGPGGSAPAGGEGLGEAISEAVKTFTTNLPSNIADLAYGVIAKAVDGLSFSNAITGIANLGSKLATGETLGTKVANAIADALDRGMSEADAAAAGAAAASDGLRGGDSGGSNNTELIASLDKIVADPAAALTATPAAPTVGTWDDYVSQFFGTPEGMQSAKDMLQGQADFIKQQYTDWQVNRGQPLNDYTAEVEKQGGLLDDLIDQSREGTGLFSPVNFTLAGQQIAFVPKAQRDQASQMAELGQAGVSNAANLYGAQASAADDTLKNSLATSPQSAGLAYLDQLKSLATTGESIDIARDTLTQSGNEADAKIDAMQPGILDYIKGIGTLFA